MNSGEIIDNHYELKRQLGRGSFGEVWLAIDTYLQQEVALKFYVAMDDNGRSEFSDEYRKVFRLRHENLLTPSHYAEWNGQPYLELEYCPTSAATLAGKMSESELWQFIADVAAGLACMHGSNPTLVHQDIKPANILRKTDGHFAITDFGISVSLRSTMLRQSGREVSGSVGGSIPYMGPELFGAKPVPVMATDIWALGVTIYEMATGELPFMGQGGVMLKNGAELPILDDFSPELNQMMQSCLALNTWDRPTAETIAKQAVAFCGNVPPVKPKKTATKPKTEYDDSATQKMQVTAPPQQPLTPTVKLNVEPIEVVFDADNNSVRTINVDCNTQWKVDCKASWLSVKVYSSSISLSADANKKDYDQTAEVTISAGSLTRTVKCTQPAKKKRRKLFLLLGIISIILLATFIVGCIKAGSYNSDVIRFKLQLDRATINNINDAEDLLTKIKAKEKESFTFLITPCSNALKQELDAKRNSLIPTLQLSNTTLTDNEGFGGYIDVTISTNATSYTATSNKSWCKISNKKDGSFRIEMTENTTGSIRNATITVKTDNGKTETIAISQSSATIEQILKMSISRINDLCPVRKDEFNTLTKVSMSGNYVEYLYNVKETAAFDIDDYNKEKKDLKKQEKEIIEEQYQSSDEYYIKFIQILKEYHIGLEYKFIGERTGKKCIIRIEYWELP